eukprot:TRINITY_DN94881_c0_g1_i1.p1 TRINITY_DN94881_c0_g1~~TRINITY_DN94881_c0_g1_i1.p1  ORF type:complete len:273 (-),score=30.41 TRINITY_DN94881_c0_g1_i1:11-829(-)
MPQAADLASMSPPSSGPPAGVRSRIAPTAVAAGSPLRAVPNGAGNSKSRSSSATGKSPVAIGTSGPTTPVALSPARPAPPPWATHGPEATDTRNPHRKRPNQAQMVQFRGTESLASLHLIDQDMAADARLSRRMNSTATTTIYADRTMSMRTSQRLPPVEEDRFNTTAASMNSMQSSGAYLRSSSAGRSETAKLPQASFEDHGRATHSTGRPRPASSGSAGVPPARGSRAAQPPWLAMPTSSRRPSRERSHQLRQHNEPSGASPGRRASAVH